MIHVPVGFSPPSVPGSETPYGPAFPPFTSYAKNGQSIQAFHSHYNWLCSLTVFQPHFAFISLQRDGPERFTRNIPCLDPTKRAETLEFLRRMLSLKLMEEAITDLQLVVLNRKHLGQIENGITKSRLLLEKKSKNYHALQRQTPF